MRYQYTSQGYLNSFKNTTPSGVKLLLIINIIVFLLSRTEFLNYWTLNNFALRPDDIFKNLYLWQCVTYLFLHADIFHLLFNMLGLWFLGRDLELLWGEKKFLEYYFISGVGAGIITVFYNTLLSGSFPGGHPFPTVGASGAIYGLLLAYGILFPNRKLYVYGIFPLKVKNGVIILAAIALFYTITLQITNISHITHLSGMIVGLGYLVYMKNTKKIMAINKLNENIKKNKENDELRKKHLNDILDKINDLGWESLTEEDKQYLKKESKNYNFNEPPN